MCACNLSCSNFKWKYEAEIFESFRWADRWRGDCLFGCNAAWGAKKPPELGFNGHWHAKLNMSIILTKCISNFAASCRGGPVAAKSPVAISDLVLLHSYVTQGLSLSKKDIKNASYDFWSSCPPPLKESWIKFFKVHTSRIGNLKSQLRITPIPEDHPTTVHVPGFGLIWNK